MDVLCTLEKCLGTYRCGQMAATVHQLAATLGRAVDAKDRRLFEHSALTADLATALALAHGLSHKQADVIHLAGHLHDIGKIGIPDAVLAKPGALDAREWAMIRDHPRIGAQILAPIELFGLKNGVRDMVLTHHERFDGGGYPHGLSGRDIPLGGRILAIADSVAAMLESRVYRPAMTFEQAAQEVERCSGSGYDPDICRDFLANLKELATVAGAAARMEIGLEPAREQAEGSAVGA
uniref:HD domain-containing protein n=1 Tax=Fundidesulfovibrio putealis TaxID=270496 RepID=A0A7C4AFX4_9BACT